MKRFVLASSVLVASISIAAFYASSALQTLVQQVLLFATTTTEAQPPPPMLSAAKAAMAKAASPAAATGPLLRHATVAPHRSATRGHSDHGWLDTYHSFSFADWYNPRYNSFGALRVLNEDRVRAGSGFPTHPHRDFEIFSYVLSGELTHRDSMLEKGAEGDASPDAFHRVARGEVQFTTGGTGISHSEFNEHPDRTVHFLQIWAVPWRRGLTPRYHTRAFDEDAKRRAFVPILSPLRAGVDATDAEERAAEPAVEGTIPIHADFAMGAGIIAPGAQFTWGVGSQGTTASKRKVFVHLPMTKGGRARVRLDGREDAVLEEGDGAFVEGVSQGDKLVVESVGDAEAEVIVLDTD